MSAPQRWPFKKGTPAARTQKSRVAVNQRIAQSMILNHRKEKYSSERSIDDIRREVHAACIFDEFRAVDLRIFPQQKVKHGTYIPEGEDDDGGRRVESI